MSSDRALAIGASIGLLAALLSVLAPGPGMGGVPDGAVATVAGVPITASAHQRVTKGLLDDTSMTPAKARSYALERLIDEEIAIQYGATMGLVERDPQIRALLVDGVLQSIEARIQDGPPPSKDQLRAVYDAQPGRFATTAKVQVSYALFTGLNAHARARDAAGVLRDGGTVRGDEVAILPGGMIPVTKLRDYLGDAPAKAVTALRPGGVSPVIHTETGAHVVRLDDLKAGPPRPFAQASEAVEAQWRRERSDRAVRNFFREARKKTTIRRAP